MSAAPSILIVDDDREIRQLLADYLDRHGYRVRGAADGQAMWRELEQAEPELIVLDLNLPGEDGLTLCRKLRLHSASLPVIMLTARTMPIDRILGLEMGADDYLSKPFEPRELLARIAGVLRRVRALPDPPCARLLRFAGWTLNLEARHLQAPDGMAIMLSKVEFRLLSALLTHPNQVLSRDQLLGFGRGRDASPFDRSIDIQISRLRHKLREDARQPRIIKTVRNDGYVLVAPVTAEPG